MDLNKLRYFTEICKEGSLSATAERLFLSRQSLSQMLKAMESELGLQLFLREKNGLVPTEAGRALLRGAGRILSAWDETESDLAAIRASGQKRIRAGFGRWSFNLWPFDQAERFHAFHSDLSLEAVSMLPDLLWQKLRDGSMDMIVTSVFPKDDASVRAFLLCKTPFVCMLGRGHPLASRRTITLQDFDGQTIYEYDGVSAYNQELRGYFSRQGIHAAYKAFPSTEISTLFLTVKENQGVWPCSSFYASLNFDPDHIAFIPIAFPPETNPPTKDIYAVVKTERSKDKDLLKYIDFLKKNHA